VKAVFQRSLKECLADAPAVDRNAVRKRLFKEYEKFDRKVVVLDDDPTGVQTVHDVSVYTDWSMRSILDGFKSPDAMFYILTNSRSFSQSKTIAVHREITRRIVEASKQTGREFLIVSRGDSTLRGHYPAEIRAIRGELEHTAGLRADGEVLLPAFLEGGRYTVGDVHYVADGDVLTPVGQTEFAKDMTFGYQNSNLRGWVLEKRGQAKPGAQVKSIPLSMLRAADPSALDLLLTGAGAYQTVVVNALEDCDIESFAAALMKAARNGKTYLIRSAATLARVLGRSEKRGLITPRELLPQDAAGGGLVIAGSHVRRTTRQLTRLLDAGGVTAIVFDQHLVLDAAAMRAEVNRVRREMESVLRAGKTAVVYTRRDRLDLHSADRREELELATAISDALTELVAKLTVRPRYIIAKGGITSCDIGVKGLKVWKARVPGQIAPGVPVWRIGAESRFPGLPYIIFPGNVGDADALLTVVAMLDGYGIYGCKSI